MKCGFSRFMRSIAFCPLDSATITFVVAGRDSILGVASFEF